MAQITLDTEQVLAIASQLESDNVKLKEILEATKSSIDSLSSSWIGEASEETRTSYETFANNFFNNYYDIIDQYVKFLRTNVSEGYGSGEQLNKGIADAYK